MKPQVKIIRYVNDNYIKLSQKEIINNFDNKDLIIKSQLPIVLKISNSFNLTTGVNLEDLFNEALEALLRAYNYYDKDNDNNATFTTYVSTVIKNALIIYNKNKSRIVIKSFSNYTDEGNKIKKEMIASNYSSVENTEELCESIFNTIPKKYAEIVTKYLLEEGNEKINFKTIAKEYNLSRETIRLRYLKGIRLLKSNELFIKKMKELKYNS